MVQTGFKRKQGHDSNHGFFHRFGLSGGPSDCPGLQADQGTARFRVWSGYGQVLFFLKKFMGAKTAGVELGQFSKPITEAEKLGIRHGWDFRRRKVRNLGPPHDVTYSVPVMDSPVLMYPEDFSSLLDNISHLTKKGGHSYHFAFAPPDFVTREAFERKGFRVDEWDTRDGWFCSLTKIMED